MKTYKIWYEDNIGLTNTSVSKSNEKAVKNYFKEYFRGYKLVSIVLQGN